MRSWTLGLFLALGACRTSTPPAPPPEAAWEAPLTFDAGRFLIDAVVDGKPARLVLDTAAAETALLDGFAKTLGEGEHSVTLSGATLRTAKVLSDPSLEAAGVQGVLSPQSLAPDGAIALDFPRKRLVAIKGKQNTWLRWLDERSPKGVVESLPRAGARDGTLTVMTRAGDGREAVTRLDARALRSEFSAALFDAGLVAGKSALEGVHVRLGDSEFGPLTVTIAPTLEGRDGTLGLDVLGSVVLLVPLAGHQALWLMTPRE